MKYTYWISRRLRLNGSSRGVNSTGVVIAVAGIAIAVVIMEFTIAIVLGFRNQITERVMGFEGKIWVLPDYDYNQGSSAATILPSQSVDSIIRTIIPDAQTYMRLSQPGILKTNDNFAGIYFTADEADKTLRLIKDYVTDGVIPDFTDTTNSNKIIISAATSKELSLSVEDKVDACFFVNDAIKSRRFEVAAIYDSGFTDYDRTIAFAPISTLRKVANADSLAGTRMMIEYSGDIDIPSAASALQSRLVEAYRNGEIPDLYPIDNVRHTGALYFNWLDLLDTNVVAIFVLMICVAGFTLVSSMFIIILERIPTIGILRSLGATKGQIRSIFIYMALRIVGIGLIIGNAIGIGLLWAQHTWHVATLDAEMYYLRHVPVEMAWGYFVLLNVGVIVMSWLILILPSRVASGISPSSTMRFE